MKRRALLFTSVVALALVTVAFVTHSSSSSADTPTPQIRPLPSLREQAREQQAWLAKRLKEVLPKIMREHGVDLWILSMREYAEDPVFFSMVSPTTFAARRRSIYVFHDLSQGPGPEKGFVRLALGGGDQGGLYTIYRDPNPPVQGAELVGDDQWRLLRQLAERADPKKIVLNVDPVHAFSDGLHAGEREALEAALGPELAKRVVREPRLAIEYIGTRIPEMMPRYREVQETVHALLATAFSNEVVKPGVTTTEDVEWWLRQRVQDLGMTVWFQPHVERADSEGWGRGVIQRGDALWVDFGVNAMGLHTDTQHLGYVLRPGETAPPAGLQACIAASNRMQDIVLAEMQPGRTGNQALQAARAAMTREKIDGTVYTHPIGDHGHGAGPMIGLWDRQEGVPVRGDLKIRPDTWFSIELQATSAIPEWNGRRIACRQEEEAYLDEKGERRWVYRRQERFYLVR